MSGFHMNGKVIRRDEKGSILPVIAVSMTTLIGVTGLGMDVGSLYYHRRIMQTAADAGALAGASEIYRAQNALVSPSAQSAAAENGFLNASGGVTVSVHHPPVSGPFAGKPEHVEVVIGQPSPTYFMRIFGWLTVDVPARAVAGVVGNSNNCVYVLDPSMASALQVNSSARLAAGCGVIVNSNSSSAIHTTSSANITATEVSVAGNYYREGGSITPTPKAGVPPEPDPLAYLPSPEFSGCTHTNFWLQNSQTQTLSPGVYCGGIRLDGNAVATLNPGVYVLRGGRSGSSVTDGSLHLTSNAIIRGTGVTIYITAGGGYPYRPIKMESSTRAQLSAPTSGTYKGILFYQDRSIGPLNPQNQPWEHRFLSSALSTFEGALYFPTQVLRVESSTTTDTRYTIIVARSLRLDSSAVLTVNKDYSSLEGGSPIRRVSLVE